MGFDEVADEVTDQLAGAFVLTSIGELNSSFANVQVSGIAVGAGKVEVLAGMQGGDACGRDGAG